MPTTHYTVEEIIQAVQAAHGILSVAAELLHCSRTTMHKYVNRFPTVREAYLEANEIHLDLAEQKLHEKITEGNLAAVFFLLKTRGKDRGYIERTEMKISSGDIDTAIEQELARLASRGQAADVGEIA